MPAVEVGALLGEHLPDDLYPFFEHVQPGTDVRERIPVGSGFPDVPAGSEPEFETAAGDVVEGGGRLGQQGGIAVADVEHQAADAGMARFRGQRAQGRQGLEVGLGTVFRRRLVEMVPGREPVDAGAVELAPEGAQVVHGQVLLADMYTERQAHDINFPGGGDRREAQACKQSKPKSSVDLLPWQGYECWRARLVKRYRAAVMAFFLHEIET